jgi:hypothetical protein
MVKGSPNPWASYRDYIKDTGGVFAQGYLPLWKMKQVGSKKSLLDRGLLFVQQKEKGGVSKPSKAMLNEWIGNLDSSIKSARGERKKQLTTQRDRLKRLAE